MYVCIYIYIYIYTYTSNICTYAYKASAPPQKACSGPAGTARRRPGATARRSGAGGDSMLYYST